MQPSDASFTQSEKVQEEVYDKCGRLYEHEVGEDFNVEAMKDYDHLDARFGRLLGIYFTPLMMKQRLLSDCMLATITVVRFATFYRDSAKTKISPKDKLMSMILEISKKNYNREIC